MKNAPNLKYQPKDKFTEVIILPGRMLTPMLNTGLKAKDENTAITYHLFTWGQSNWQTWRISALSTMNAALRVSISRGRSNQSRSMLSLKSWRWLAYRRRNYTKVSPTGSRRTGTTTCNGSANRLSAGKYLLTSNTASEKPRYQ